MYYGNSQRRSNPCPLLLALLLAMSWLRLADAQTVPTTTVSVEATAPIATEGGQPGNFRISLDSPTTFDVAVNFAVSGSATVGQDYTDIGQSVLIPAQQTSVVIPVQALTDTVTDPDETVIVTLLINGFTIDPLRGTATVTIQEQPATVVPPPSPPPAATTGPLADTPGLTDTEKATARALDQACPAIEGIPAAQRTSGQNDLLTICTSLPASGAIRSGLRSLAPDEIAVQGRNSIIGRQTLNRNVRERMSQRRNGEPGQFDISGLGFRVANKTVSASSIKSMVTSFARARAGTRVPAPLTRAYPTTYQAPITMRLPAAGTRQSLGPEASMLPARPSGGGASADSESIIPRWGVFVTGNGSFGDKDATLTDPGFDFETKGVTAGIDYRLGDNFMLGSAFGFLHTDTDIDNDGGKSDINGYSFSLYGSYFISGFYADAIGSMGFNDYQTNRGVVFNNIDQRAKGDPHGMEYSVSLGGGYDFYVGGLSFGPYARAELTEIDIDDYQEQLGNTGPGVGSMLAIDDQEITSLTTTVGGQLNYAVSTRVGILVPQLRFDWEREFKDDRRFLVASFLNDPLETSFAIPIDNIDRSYFNLGAGVSATFPNGKTGFISYEALLGRDEITEHALSGGFRMEF